MTERQAEVIELVVEGMSDAEIGRELFIAPSTVKYHLKFAFTAMKVQNRTQAAVWWVREIEFGGAGS